MASRLTSKLVCPMKGEFKRNSKAFKEIVKELDIHPDNLEVIITQIANNEANWEKLSLEDVKSEIKKVIKNEVTASFDKAIFDEALEVWESMTNEGLRTFTSSKNADSFERLLKENLGEENVYRYMTSKGLHAIRASKPTLEKEDEEGTEELEEEVLTPMEEAQSIVEVLREYSDAHIRFDEKTHKYYVDGEETDTTVTRYISSGASYGAWGPPSSALGNTGDAVTRDFFNGNLKKSYPNLTKEQLKALVDDLKRFQKILDGKFGVRKKSERNSKYRVITDEKTLRIAAQFTIKGKDGNPVTKTMGGTMDMLIYDSEGNFYILDMKVKRNMREEDRLRYSRQLSLYKAILEANFPQLKGRIKELRLIKFDVDYDFPIEVGGSTKYEVDKKTGQLYANDEPIQNSKSAGYFSPRLSLDSYEDLITADMMNFSEEFSSMSDTDKDLLEEEFGNPANSNPEPYKASAIDSQKNSLYNNPLLTAEERSFLASSLMKNVSFMITNLQQNSKYLKNAIRQMELCSSDEAFAVAERLSQYIDIDFTSMSRMEIIKTIGFTNLSDWVKEFYFNPENRDDLETRDSIEKLRIAYDNWEALKQEGYATLITLEDITVVKADNIIKEGIDAQLQEDLDSGNTEEHEREYWMVNFRQISATARLSARVKRELDRLRVLEFDAFGEMSPKLDETFGMPVYLNSGEAASNILEWVKDCSTITEMEEVLRGLVDSHPWLVVIVGMHDDKTDIEGLIEQEPFRSQFFSNFRRDFTEYGVVRVEVDADGNRKYITHIINTTGATKFLLNQIVNKYQEGIMKNIIIPVKGDIEGRGKVNIRTLNLLKSEYNKIASEIDDAFKRGHKVASRTISKNIDRIATLLGDLGIAVTPAQVKTVLLGERSFNNYQNSAVGRVLTSLNYMLSTLNAHKEDIDYNPMLKGEDGNIYGQYESIIQIFSKAIQNGIEASAYENGKMYYSFQTPSYMGNLVKNLKDSLGDPQKFDEFMEREYSRYRWFYGQSESGRDKWYNYWLELLTKSEDHRQGLEHKVQIAFDGTDYRDLSELGYTVSLMSEYFYDKSADKKWAWYRLPILSNKPSSEFLKFSRYTDKNTNGGYKGFLAKKLVDVANQEILRIRTVLDNARTEGEGKIVNWDISEKFLNKNPKFRDKLRQKDEKGKYASLTFSDLVKNGKLITSNSGASFKFMEVLNEELVNKTKLGKLILDKINGVKLSDKKQQEFIEGCKEAIQNNMERMFAREQNQWREIGLYETETQEFTYEVGKGKKRKTVRVKLPVYKYLQSFIDSPITVYKRMLKSGDYDHLFNEDNSPKGKSLNSEFLGDFMQEIKKQADKALEEYVWNDLFATINIIQLTATDLAYFKNVEDFQKRYAAVHSPGIRMNTEATFEDENNIERRYAEPDRDGVTRCRVLHIADSIETSDITENVRKVLYDRVTQERDPKKKSELKKMADLILSAFEGTNEDGGFNITDGQGYSSPTAYRKKMGMLGRWPDAEERAYNNIVQGNYTVEDLGIMWQPLKPFVYTQMSKTTNSSVMVETKVPMQVKDSEYMLLLADALMRSGNKQNKLTAIFDFMEDSAYDGRISGEGKVFSKGTYNGKGIDTVAFVSTSKFGASGVVDISDKAISDFKKYNPHYAGDSNYSAIKTLLESAAYYNPDHTEDPDNDFSRYNDKFVHEFPFESYALQQEVPAHLRGNQLMGSQIRILSISDIDPDAQFHVSKNEVVSGNNLTEEYQNLIAENVEDSFRRLSKEFDINETDKFKRNKAIEKLLTEAILKDQRYGADLLRACTLNDQGEFTIPLCDPIQSIRVQQLINSIIKSRINKQQVKGGPVVQTSVYGMSDDLSIRFKDKEGNLLMTFSEFKERNKYDISSKEAAVKMYRNYVWENQGELAYWEIYLPIPSEAMESALIAASERDGIDYIENVEEAVKKGIIEEDMLKAIGYRIPTEDKYSMAPMRIKGFMPRAAGEAIMMPKEVTLLTGSDFDIDKMYIMFKEFTQSDYYNIEEAWEDFYTNSPEGREARATIDSAKEHLIQDELAKMSSDPDKYDDYLSLSEEDFRKVILAMAKKQGWDRDYKWATGVQEAFSKWFDRKQKEAHKTGEKFKEVKGKGNRAGRNNRIFDLQWAVLTGSDTASKMFNPGSFDVQKKTARIVNILKDPSNERTYEELSNMSLEKLSELASGNTGKSILFSTTQVYFHKQNMTAGKLIGVFANNNTSHAFVSLQNIKVNLDDKVSFRFDGSEAITDSRLDELKARDGVTLISKNIAGFLAASVDAVKDPVLNFLNLNTFTSGPAMVLTRLGFDVDSVGLLLTQPIIEKASSEYFRRNNEGYVTQEEIISSLKEFINDNYGIDSEPLEKDLVATQFKKEDLAEGLPVDLNIMNKSQAEFQLRALMLFQRLIRIANQLQTLTFLTKFNSVTNAPGPTIADTLVMKERYRRFRKLYDDKINLLSDSALQVIDNSPILKAFYNSTMSDSGASSAIFGPFFPHYSRSFQSVLERFSTFMKTAPDAKLINKLVNDYILYILTKGDNPVIDTSKENRQWLIHKFPKEFREQAETIINNPLIDIIQVKSRDRKCPVPTLVAETGSFNISAQESVKNAWSSLMQNESTREFASNLFFYNILRSGFAFSPKTFTHLASVDVKLAIERYTEALRDPNFTNGVIGGESVDFLIDDFLYQFRRNHASDVRVVPRVSENKNLEAVIKDSTITFTFKKNSNKGVSAPPAFILNPLKVDLEHIAPVIWYNKKLYMAPSHFIENGNIISVRYVETNPLGNTNNFLEYNANESGHDIQSAMEQPVERDSEDDGDMTPTKDSAVGQEEDAIERFNRLSRSDLNFLVDSVFTKDELDELLEIEEEKDQDQRTIDFIMKHFEASQEEGRNRDKKYRKELKKIIDKLC